MSTYHAYGLFYLLEARSIPINLLDVAASAQIKDLSAQVTVKQRYQLAKTSTLNHPVEASYTFPIPARAAVSSFVLIKQDGTRVVGLVQEKEEAKNTYDKAKSEGKLASLMVQDTPDVFTVSVGNILAGEIVTVELMYSTELTEDEETDSIRFHLPAHVGARYGASPVSAPAASSVSTDSSFFNFTASIESHSPIAKIGSPSHTVSTELGPDPSLPNAASLPFSNYARVSFSAPKDLSADMILSIKSSGLDSPRCIAEVHPSDDRKTFALALTMVPRFKLPDIPGQEFIFLVDRSGSMSGLRITTAKKALIVMLRSLPALGTDFNVFSFGDSCSALWKSGSRPYNQATLDEATSHVDSMEANFGGTEVRAALEAVFAVRKTDKPTSLFVLTDGDAWDLENVLSSVKSAVAASSSTTGAYLRIYTLGIGEASSTAMVEGIARVGNGASSFVSDGESFTGKTTRLLKAARAPLISNVQLEWPEKGQTQVLDEKDADDGFEILSDVDSEETVAQKDGAAPISLFDKDVDPLESVATTPLPKTFVTLSPPPAIQMSPHVIRGISPANRLYIYTIVSSSASSIPKFVTLSGELPSGDKVTLDVPVTLGHLHGSTSIHTLAARKLIQDWEDGQHDAELTKTGLDDYALKETVKAEIVRLGKTYSIASTHTSFVAVDESEAEGARLQKLGRRIRQEDDDSDGSMAYSAPRPMSTASLCKAKSAKSANISNFSMRSGGATHQQLRSAPAAYASSPPPPISARAAASSSPGIVCRSKNFCFARSPHSSFPASSAGVDITPLPLPPFDSKLPSSDRLDRLARLQSFDGSFATSVVELIGGDLTKICEKLCVQLEIGEKEKIAATILAMRYLKREMKDDTEAWEGIWEKAKAYVVGVVGGEEEFEKANAEVDEACA
ncbi:hypothetical protein P7C70_g5015, partial [Phenoliferia sp. Uapishka_3]